MIAAQGHITLPMSGKVVLLDPGIYVASMGSALQLDVGRASYTRPIMIRQVLRTAGGGTRFRQLPRTVLSGFYGLRSFFRLRVVNAQEKTVYTRLMLFCPTAMIDNVLARTARRLRHTRSSALLSTTCPSRWAPYGASRRAGLLTHSKGWEDPVAEALR